MDNLEARMWAFTQTKDFGEASKLADFIIRGVVPQPVPVEAEDQVAEAEISNDLATTKERANERREAFQSQVYHFLNAQKDAAIKEAKDFYDSEFKRYNLRATSDY